MGQEAVASHAWWLDVVIRALGVAIPTALLTWYTLRRFRQSTASVDTRASVRWQDENHVILTVALKNKSRIAVKREPGKAVVWVMEHEGPPPQGRFYSDLMILSDKPPNPHRYQARQEVMTTEGVLEPNQTTCVDVVYTVNQPGSWLHVMFKFECPLTGMARRQRGQRTDSFATTIWLAPRQPWTGAGLTAPRP